MEVLIFKKINKWINCTIKETHNHCEVIIWAIPISIVTQIRHEIVNLNI